MQITWLIGHSCKCGNILRRVILIGRGLFLAEIMYERNSVSECEVDDSEAKSATATSENNFQEKIYQEKQKTEMIKLILCSNQRTGVRSITYDFNRSKLVQNISGDQAVGHHPFPFRTRS